VQISYQIVILGSILLSGIFQYYVVSHSDKWWHQNYFDRWIYSCLILGLHLKKYVQGTRKTNICFAFRLFVDQECVRFKQYLL